MAISSAPMSVHLVPRISSPRSSLGSSSSAFFSNERALFAKKSGCLILGRRRAQGQKGLKCNCFFGLGVPELAVIAGVVILVFGPKKLPEIGRSAGKTVKSFQQAANEFAEELRKAPEESTESPPEQSAASGEDKEAGEKENPEDSGV